MACDISPALILSIQYREIVLIRFRNGIYLHTRHILMAISRYSHRYTVFTYILYVQYVGIFLTALANAEPYKEAPARRIYISVRWGSP